MINNLRCQIYIYIYIYLLTSWCRVLLEKLTGLQLVKKFPACHGTRRFITALTSVRHLSLSWVRPIQSIYPHPTSWRSILILSTHLPLGLPSGLFPSDFPTKILSPLSSPIRATCPAHLIHIYLYIHTRTYTHKIFFLICRRLSGKRNRNFGRDVNAACHRFAGPGPGCSCLEERHERNMYCTDMRDKRGTYIFIEQMGAKDHFRDLAIDRRIKVTTQASQNKI